MQLGIFLREKREMGSNFQFEGTNWDILVTTLFQLCYFMTQKEFQVNM